MRFSRLAGVGILLWIPHTAAGIWATKNTMPTKRAAHAVVAFSNKIYINGGTSGGGVGMDTFERYDPGTDAWGSINSIPTARIFPAFAELNVASKGYDVIYSCMQAL